MLSDEVLRAIAAMAGCGASLKGEDAGDMARELLAARKVIASSRVVVEWAEPVTTDDWTEYDAAQRDLREYDATTREG